MINKKYVEDIFSIGTSSSHSVFHRNSPPGGVRCWWRVKPLDCYFAKWALHGPPNMTPERCLELTWGVRISCISFWLDDFFCVCVCNKPSEMMSLYRYSGWMMSYGVIFRVFSLLYSCGVGIDAGDNALLLSVYYLRSSTAMKGFSSFGDRNLSNFLVVSREFGDRFCGHCFFFVLKSSFFIWIDHLTSGAFQTHFFSLLVEMLAILSNIYIIFCNWAETTS